LESNLSAYAEVCDYIQDDLLEHGVFRQFLEDVLMGVELVRVHRREVHHVAYIQVVDPVVMVFDSQGVSYVDFESLAFLDGVDLFGALESRGSGLLHQGRS